VKCHPERAIDLREEFACILPGYHMNKKHWNTIVVDGTLGRKQLQEHILHSYGLVAKKRKKAGM
jgi:predicted DNA-binding protein (MmcQ/YjbR family)